MMSKVLTLLVLLPYAMGQYAILSGLNSIAYGPGLKRATVGEPTQFWIQAVDTMGQNMSYGGNQFKITLRTPYGGNGAKPVVLDLGNGLYHITYTIALTYPPLLGMYSMEVITDVNGVKMNMKGSPFPVQVIDSAPFDSSKTYAQSPPDYEVAGAAGMFKVVASDTNGNPLTQGFLTFFAQMTDGEASVMYTGADGEYMVNYLSTKAGPTTLTVRAGAPLQHISGSPFAVLVSPGPVAPKNCEVSGPGLAHGVAGQITHFTITERDMFGNTRTTTSSASVTAKFEYDSTTKVTIQKQKNGTWTGSYIAPEGSKRLVVEMDGVAVSGSPFDVYYAKQSQMGTVVGALAGVGVLGGAFWYYRKQNAEKQAHRHESGDIQSKKKKKSQKAVAAELASDSDDGSDTGVY